jgi:DNA-binding NarL/FixJ family response regulator
MRSIHILVADDHPIVRVTLRQLFRRADKTWDICGEAGDGQTAVSKALELRPDLIILDYSMPLLDGVSAGRKIRALLPNVPILIHTIFASSDMDREAKEAGIQGVVEKGNAGALLAEIRKVLGPRSPVSAEQLGKTRKRRYQNRAKAETRRS